VNTIAASIQVLADAPIDAEIATPFATIFLAGASAYKVRRVEHDVVTNAAAVESQRLTVREYKRGHRFAAAAYRGLTSIALPQGRLTALIMRRFDDSQVLRTKLRANVVSNADISAIIAGFRAVMAVSVRVDRPTAWYDHALDRLGPLLLRFGRAPLAESMRKRLKRVQATLRARETLGYCWSSHGDLHSGNIYLADGCFCLDPAVAATYMFECDYLAQLADIVVDFLACGCSEASRRIALECCSAMDDCGGEDLLFDFFVPFRASLRLAIASLYQHRALAFPHAGVATAYETLVI
jgi:aminoglycoside phosphotransferase family enzyme